MELRDYLMPGEYILGIIRKIDIDDGKFSNLAITNKRFIAFNVKKKRSLFKTWEEVTDMKSLFFEGLCGVSVRWVLGDTIKRMEIGICEKIVWPYDKKQAKYKEPYCTGNITMRINKKTISGTPLDHVHNTLRNIFEPLAKRAITHRKSKKEWNEEEYKTIYVLKNEKECIDYPIY